MTHPLNQRGARVAVALMLGVFAMAAVGWPVPAVAHPWGIPPEAQITADDNEVVIDWRAEPDDALLIGIDLGLVDPERLDWTQDGPQPPDGQTGAELLPQADALDAYLLDRIQVTQGGELCEGRVERFDDFVSDGARTVHACPGEVDAVEVEISMLHDLHEAYRTFAEGPGEAAPSQAVFTSSEPRQRWTFGEAAADGSLQQAWWELFGVAAAAAALAAAVAALAWHRRRRRRLRRAAQFLGPTPPGLPPLDPPRSADHVPPPRPRDHLVPSGPLDERYDPRPGGPGG